LRLQSEKILTRIVEFGGKKKESVAWKHRRDPFTEDPAGESRLHHGQSQFHGETMARSPDFGFSRRGNWMITPARTEAATMDLGVQRCPRILPIQLSGTQKTLMWGKQDSSWDLGA
jgi:hypothetical protein